MRDDVRIVLLKNSITIRRAHNISTEHRLLCYFLLVIYTHTVYLINCVIKELHKKTIFNFNQTKLLTITTL